MKFVHDDGGRAAAGYKGSAHDCVCRAVAIATGLPYQTVYGHLNTLGSTERVSKRRAKSKPKSTARTGVYKSTIKAYLTALGWTFTPTMFIGSGCKVHLADYEIPMRGNLIVNVSKHMTAVIDGVIHDTFDPSRCGTRCVYGYWQKGDDQ